MYCGHPGARKVARLRYTKLNWTDHREEAKEARFGRYSRRAESCNGKVQRLVLSSGKHKLTHIGLVLKETLMRI